MPELRREVAAGCLHFAQHLRPTGEGFIAVEIRHVVVVEGDGVRGRGSLGDDETGAAFGPAGKNYLRFSLVSARNLLEEALARIERVSTRWRAASVSR